MSEQRPIQGRITAPASDQAAETQLRQALEHMGGRRPAPAPAASNRMHGSGAQRHRYVREGEVPVVHAALGRQTARPDPALQQDKALIEQLRRDLERERATREAAERSLHEARAAHTAQQTRLVHLEMDLQAAQEQLAARAAIVRDEAPPPRRRRVARPAEDEAEEPQPVKWWIGDD